MYHETKTLRWFFLLTTRSTISICQNCNSKWNRFYDHYNCEISICRIHYSPDRIWPRIGGHGCQFPTRVAAVGSPFYCVLHLSLFTAEHVTGNLHGWVWVTYSLLEFGELKMFQRLYREQNRIFCVALSHKSTDILVAREAPFSRLRAKLAIV